MVKRYVFIAWRNLIRLLDGIADTIVLLLLIVVVVEAIIFLSERS